MLRTLVKISVLLGIVGAGVWVLYEAQQKLTQSGPLVAGTNPLDLTDNTNSGEDEPRALAFNENSPQNPFDDDSNLGEPTAFSNEDKSEARSDVQDTENPFSAEDTTHSRQSNVNEPKGLDFNDKITRTNATNDGSGNTFPQVAENSDSFGKENNLDQSDDDFFDSGNSTSAAPEKLTVPKTVDTIPTLNKIGPKLFTPENKNSGEPVVQDDPFDADPLPKPIQPDSRPEQTSIKPAANKGVEVQEDPFGGFEEQQAAPRKLPVASAKEPAPLPIFPDANSNKKEMSPAPIPVREQSDGTVVIRKRDNKDKVKKSAFNAFDNDTPAPITKGSSDPVPLVMEKSDDTQSQPLVNKIFRGTGTIDKPVPRGEDHPHLTIEKIAPANAVLGEPMIYRIVVRNKGKSKANKVVVEDSIPKGTDLDGTIPRAELTANKLVWKLGSLEPGEEQTIRVRVIPRAAGQIGSIATVNFVSEIAAVTKITAPKLQLELTGPKTATLGEPVVFVFRVTNTGDSDAKQVVIRNLIPKGLRHPDGNDLEYEVGTLPAGKSQEIKLAMTAITEGEIENKAVATARGGIRDESIARLQVDGPILKILHSGPKRRYIGRTASFKNDISNESDKIIALATVTETIPREFKFLRASGGGSYNEQSRQVTWQVAQLSPGESKRLEVILACKEQGTVECKVIASVNNIVRAEVGSETIIEGYPRLQTVVAGAEEPIAIGEQVTYRVQINNKGTADAQQVKVEISVPPQLQYVSVKGAKAIGVSDNKITFTPISSISAKSDSTISITCKAITEGKGHVGVHVQGNHMSRALLHEEEVIVYDN